MWINYKERLLSSDLSGSVVPVDPNADAGRQCSMNKKTPLFKPTGKQTQTAPLGGKTRGSVETQKQDSFAEKAPRNQDSGRLRRE